MAGDEDISALDAAFRHAIAYRRALATRAVRVEPSHSDIAAQLVEPWGESLPTHGDDSAAVIARLIAAEPGVMPSTGPRFFAFVIGGAHPAAIAADWVASVWDQNAGNPIAGPAAAAIEQVVAAWALDLLDLPRDAGVGIVTGATMGNFCGIAAARHALLKRAGWDVEAQGLFGAPEITVIAGEEAHPTLFSSLRLAGFGAKRHASVPTDDEGRMRIDAFAAALGDAKGPVLVCAQAGNIHSGGFDPIPEIAALCRARGAWLHIDGAFGLWARANPATRALAAGCELADSWSVDCHKMLNTTFDGAFAIVRDPAALAGAMGITASYLPQAGAVRNPSAFTPELSRRARGLPIWAVLRALGREGLAAALERCCANARLMAARLGAVEGVAVLNDVVFNQATFRFGGSDALTSDVVARVQRSGVCWVQTADWRGRTIMRFSVCNHDTSPEDIERSADAVIQAFKEARA